MHVWGAEEKCIFHVDVNSAFLSWSALRRLEEDPQGVDLRTIPSAVAGDVRTRHGIITAKSIPAGKMGVQTGEPVVKALQKCPQLVLVQSDFALYRMYSAALMDLLREYTDLVEPASIDEAYLDMTQSRRRFPGENGDAPWPLSAAHEIRRRVFRELGFTVNVGISVNKLLAKMASDFEKPDRVHTLFPEEIPLKMWPLPMRELHGCGKATCVRLHQMGIDTIAQAAAMDPALLQANLGEKSGAYIWRSANGEGSDRVRPEHDKAKSISNEVTTPEDITYETYGTKGLEIVRALSEKVASRMEKAGVYGQTVFINVKTEDFRRHSRQTALSSATRDPEVIRQQAELLMAQMLCGEDGLFAKGHAVRLIGVGCAGLTDGSCLQMDLFSWAQSLEEEKERKREEQKRAESARRKQEEERARRSRLEEMMQKVRNRYGEDAIYKGAGEKPDKSHPDDGGSVL